MPVERPGKTGAPLPVAPRSGERQGVAPAPPLASSLKQLIAPE
jgi:hypothetical protein